MSDDRTTTLVGRLPTAPAGDRPADRAIRKMLNRAVGRLRVLCAGLLYRGYLRPARPLKPLRETRPRTFGQCFALTNQHVRWERNDRHVVAA